MNEDPGAFLPELSVLGGAVVGLLVGLWLPRRRQWVVAAIAAVALLAAVVTAIVAGAGPDRMVFDDTFAVDVGTATGRVVVAVATLLVMGLALEPFRAHHRETELYVLLLLAALGSMLLAGTSDLLLLVAAYLVASIPAYALAGFAKDPAGTEASLKYYLMGAFLGILMLGGVTVLYGATGGTAYGPVGDAVAGAPRGAVAVGVVALLAGLLFKTGAVPGHFWVPDVTEGASIPVAAFVTTIPKIGGLVAVFRLFDTALGPAEVRWPLLLALLAAASMTLGNLAAFFQTSPRRLLAYSTVSQVGYVLMAVAAAGRSDLAAPSLLFYLAGYAVTNVGAFAVVAALPGATTLTAYSGLFRRQRWLALTLVVCLLGLVGTPPTAVFVGKLTVFSAATDAGLTWLMVVAALNTVASLFYYLRWILPLFTRSGTPPTITGTWPPRCAYTAGALTLALGLASGLFLDTLTAPLLP